MDTEAPYFSKKVKNLKKKRVDTEAPYFYRVGHKAQAHGSMLGMGKESMLGMGHESMLVMAKQKLKNECSQNGLAWF